MSALQDPTQYGFAPDRLARIDDHLEKYLADGRLPGWQVLVSRRGAVVHHTAAGQRNLATGADWTTDTIARIFSMTKPLTSVAAMMLVEEGLIKLKDPVSRFIPSFGESRVYRSGNEHAPVTEPVTEPMLVWHLLTHTAGLTYGFHRQHLTDALYRNAGYEWGVPAGVSLAEACDRWASLPLAFQPGTEWLYSVATDVLGRVVEVVSGQSLSEFFQARILGPLGMQDTGFSVDESKRDRCAGLYVRNPADGTAVESPLDLNPPTEKTIFSGGGGLWGTVEDYHRFAQMLLGRGELDGVRLLGSRTVEYMTRNHLPGDADLDRFGRPLFAETEMAGVGFGLGVSTIIDPAAYKVPSSFGSYSWGGAASTTFWNDPVEELSVVFFTQLLPSSTYPLRPELSQLVYQALVD